MQIRAYARLAGGGCVLLLCAAITNSTGSETDNMKPGLIRVACVGDSITFGQDIREREKFCYPAILGNLLGGRYEVLEDHPEYFPDNVHPNAAGAAVIAKRVHRALAR